MLCHLLLAAYYMVGVAAAAAEMNGYVVDLRTLLHNTLL